MNLSDQLDLEDYDWLIDRWRFSSPSQLAPQIYILSTFVGKMNLSDEVDLEDYDWLIIDAPLPRHHSQQAVYF